MYRSGALSIGSCDMHACINARTRKHTLSASAWPKARRVPAIIAHTRIARNLFHEVLVVATHAQPSVGADGASGGLNEWSHVRKREDDMLHESAIATRR